jgi:uncharacterized membrane protein YoaK (UPF0700 family)
MQPIHAQPVTTIDHRAADVRVRDRLLDALTISSGAVDAISFVALGKVFTAFMTGNIAFLGLRFAGYAAAPSVVAVLSSMGGFAAGVYFATLIVTLSKGSLTVKDEHKPPRLWPARTTVALGVSLIAHASFLAVWFATRGQPTENATHVLLGLWALAMGIQSAAVRRLDVGGVFTTAATATVIFLAGDFANRPVTGAERRRLAGVLVSLLVGATAGGLLLLHAPIYAPLLPFVITSVVVATAAIAFRDRNAATAWKQRARTWRVARGNQ